MFPSTRSFDPLGGADNKGIGKAGLLSYEAQSWCKWMSVSVYISVYKLVVPPSQEIHMLEKM